VTIWTFKLEPLYRTSDPNKPRPSYEDVRLTPWQVALDAFDLCCNLRGIGWNWSKGLHLPKETRRTDSRILFILSTLRSFILTVIIFDVLHYTVQSFGWETFGSGSGGTIFGDESEPAVLRYPRATLVAFLSGLTICLGIQVGYYMLSLIGLVVFQNDPKTWPPIFDTPWFATSLADFWARRWHQAFRDLFVSCGSKPLARVFGRMGTVMGAFLISGILHVTGLWGMGRGTEFWTVAGYFLVNGVGLILERLWKQLTGRRVQGVWGNVWTMIWVVGWGVFLVDAWARKGLVGSVFFTQDTRPMNIVIRHLSSLYKSVPS